MLEIIIQTRSLLPPPREFYTISYNVKKFSMVLLITIQIILQQHIKEISIRVISHLFLLERFFLTLKHYKEKLIEYKDQLYIPTLPLDSYY